VLSDRGRRELEQLVDDLADRLQRSVVVDDPTIRLIYSSRHFGDEDQQRIRAVLQHDVGSAATAHILGAGVETWSAPGPIPAREDLGMARRWCAPLRWQGRLLGVLMVIDADASLTDGQRAEIAACGADLATLLHRDGAQGPSMRDAMVTEVLSDDPVRRTAGLAALREDGFRDADGCTVTTVRVLGDQDPIRIEAVLRSIVELLTRTRAATVAYTVHGVQAALLQVGASAEPAAAHALAAAVGERVSATAMERVVCGISARRADLPHGRDALRDSEIAAKAATVVPGLGDVCHYHDIGPYAVLLRLPDAELTAELLPAQLVTLRESDPSGALTETLAAYLDHAGNSPRTAEALHIHRTSLYYRLGRIRDLTGADLDDGRTRLALQLGLAVLPLLGP
jgi:intracellular sulfur oxidation DsrE/DsrF family protein